MTSCTLCGGDGAVAVTVETFLLWLNVAVLFSAVAVMCQRLFADWLIVIFSS